MERMDGAGRADAIQRIRGFFLEQRDEELGELAAGIVFDFVAEELGWISYNQGVADARASAQQAAAGLEEALDVLERLPPR